MFCSDLGGDVQRCSLVQQGCGHVLVALAGSQVEGRVAGGGGGVWARSVLQQLQHDVWFTQTTGDMQGRLVVLDTHTHTQAHTHTHTEVICNRSISLVCISLVC